MAKPKIVYQKFTFWQMINNVVLALINKGQLGTAILGLICVIFAVRLPVVDLKEVALGIIHYLKTGHLLGYLLSIIALLGWFYHSRMLRRQAFREQGRIGNEKSELQRVALPGKVKSSSKVK